MNPRLTRMVRYLAPIALAGALSNFAFAQTGVVLFQDQFNRADSDSLGMPPWTEINENDMQVVQGSYQLMPSVIEVHNNAFAFHYSIEPIVDIFGCFKEPPGLCRNFGRPAAFAPLTQPATLFPVTVSFDFTPHDDERMQHRIGLMSSSAGFAFPGNGLIPVAPATGLEIEIQHTSSTYDNSAVRIALRDGTETELALKPWSFQFESGTTYHAQVVIAADHSITATIGDGVSSDSVTSPPAAVGFPLDQLYVIDAQGGVSNGWTDPAEFRLYLDNFLVTQTPIPVGIDIKPGSLPNSINLSSAGVVPVAILSSPDFDATTIDADTVTLAGASVKMVGKSGKLLVHEQDVNNDGLLDLVCQVLTEQFLIVPGDAIAVLEAATEDGLPVRGQDSIQIVGE